MSQKTIIASSAGLVLLTACLCSGCFTMHGPTLGLASVPIPVSPFIQKEYEDIAWDEERYDKVPILGPVTQGGPPVALDPPSDDQIIRALERARPLQGGIPFCETKQRDNIRITKELIADYTDPPRFVPHIGPAQLHHAHYKCTIYYSETTHVGWPIPYTIENEDAREVIYVDHDHFHMVGNVDGGPSSPY